LTGRAGDRLDIGRSGRARRGADESLAGSEAQEQLRRAGVERDDPPRQALEPRGLVAGSADADRVRLRELAERFGPLAAARAGGAEDEDREGYSSPSHETTNDEVTTFFTPEEANAVLAEVRPLVERMVAERRELLQHEGELAAVREKVGGNGGAFDVAAVRAVQEAQAAANEALRETVERILELGVEVKDLDRGLVDFPAAHPADGSTVLLCWHLGEDEIAYWHGIEEGFAGRKPLPFERTD
jgi:hypothetical protein